MKRIFGRKATMSCAYCLKTRPWPHHFVNSMTALCLVCWLDQHEEQVGPMREALAEHDLRKLKVTT